MTLLEWLLIIFVAVTIFTVLYVFIIKPNLNKKLGYKETPYMRPARSFILDTSKYEYGWGEVVGSEKLSPYKTSFLIRTQDGDFNFPYFRWELESLDLFNSVAGEGSQTFKVKDTLIDDEQHHEKSKELIELRKRLNQKISQVDYLDKQKTLYKNNIEKMIDDRVNTLMEFKRSEAKKQTTTELIKGG